MDSRYKIQIGKQVANSAPTPVNPTDIANKQYVDDSGIYEGNVWRPEIKEANTAQQNADLINNAILAAEPVKGSVILPAGDFTSRTINHKPNVRLRGQGTNATKLTSTAAEPLISYTDTTLQNSVHISDMTLFGGVDSSTKVGTIGIKIGRIAQFQLNRVRIENFVDTGVEATGALIGSCDHLFIRFCATGFKAREGNSSIGTLKPNLVVFRDCTFSYCSTWGVDWLAGTSIHFDKGCNIEYNGTSGNANTGAINFDATGAYANDQFGVTVEGSWLEQNKGTVFNITSHTSGSLHRIANCMVNSGTIENVIDLTAGTLVVTECDFKEYTVSVDNGVIETRNVNIGAVTLLNGATHKKNNVENLTGTVLNLGNVNGDNYNYSTPSNATTYTATNKVENAFVSCLINAPSEPTVTGATKIKGVDFAADTSMEMIVEVKNGNVRYFFLSI